MPILDSFARAIADRYSIEREIGRGGMATVFLARDTKHERQVAVKVLDPELGAVIGADRFLSEIRVTAKLQHPNLLPLFDSGEADGLLYYVMPYVAGESLRHRLDREQQLPQRDAVQIAVGVANALAHAHGHGVIHRDLKPENILLQAGQPIVADFGIALALSNAGGARVTQTGLSLGTPQYMSPEQATGDRAIDGRTDIYSLAAVTYEMLTGEPPHSGPNAQAIIAKLITTAPQPVRSLRPGTSPNVAMAVEAGLAKLPADRIGSAAEFAAALTNPAFTIDAVSEPSTNVRGKRAWSTIGLGALAALSIAAAAWGWLRPTPPPPVIRYELGLDSVNNIFQGGRFGRVALSPDGESFVYVGGARNGLMLRRRDAIESTEIPGADAAGSPTFSPDGRRVAFIQNARQLRVVSLDGAAPITVADGLIGLAGLWWGEDGMIYADSAGSSAIVRFAPRPNSPPQSATRLDTAAGERNQIFPQLLPGGRYLLFTSNLRLFANSGSIVALDLESGARHEVVANAIRARYDGNGYLLYATPEGTLLAAPFDVRSAKTTGEPVQIAQGLATTANLLDFAVSASGRLVYATGTTALLRELVWVNRDGNATTIDSAWREPFVDPAVAPDGRAFAVSTGSGPAATSGDIWIRRLDTGARFKLTVEPGVHTAPSWSRDSRFVTYLTAYEGGRAVVRRRADGSAQPETLITEIGLRAGELTRDGQWLVYLADRPQGRLFARRIGDTVSTDLHPGEVLDGAAVSPDGRWSAFTSLTTRGGQVFVTPFPNTGAARWLVSPRVGRQPAWSHDGTELFFLDPSIDAISAVPVGAGSTFSFGMPLRLFSATPYSLSFSPHPDGSRFLMIRRDPGLRQRLSFVENWTGLMTKASTTR